MIEANSAIRIREIDGLRGIAILSVVIYHLLVLPLTPFLEKIGAREALTLLAYGVDLFFVISGFLIGAILLKIKDASGMKSFYIRRILRIWPLYYFLLWIVYVIIPDKSTFSATPYWSFPLFIFNLWQGFGKWVHQALGPLWSVAIEEQFYIVGPVLFFFLNRKQLTTFLLAGLVLSPVLRLVLLLAGTGINIWKFTPTRIDGICMGLLLAIFLSDPSNVMWTTKKLRGFSWLAILLVVCLIPAILLLDPVVWNSFGHSLIVLAFGCVVLVVHIRCLTHKERTFLDWAILRYMGLRCYSIYLFHMFFSFLALSVSDNFYMRLFVNLSLTLLFAHFSWRYVEAPLIKLGRKFSYEHVPEKSVTTATVH